IAIALLQAGIRPPDMDRGTWLRNHIEAGRLEDLRWPGFARDRAALRQFYEANGFNPAWIQGNQPTFQAISLISSIRAAGTKGLDPEDYDGSRWAARLDEIAGVGTDAVALSRFDLELTIAAMRIVSDLDSGRANPGIFRFDSDVRGSAKLANWVRARLQFAADTPDAIPAALRSLEPPFPAYRQTEAALARCRTLLAGGQPAPFPVSKRPVKPGDPYPAAPQLYAFLQRLGDAPQSGAVPADYSGVLVTAVMRFQERHGLAPDGVLGAATFRALNAPIAQRVKQIELTLERWRWLPRQFDHPPLIVNIPQFELAAFDSDNRVALHMKVIVGKAWGHKTPIFAAQMSSVIFHPWWEVPENIARDELQPKADKDPGYLARNHYVIVPAADGGTRIRQRPGPDNALGAIKFVFPNRYDVYMHGTPATELFSKTRRDFSHGCIRVEDPERLAQWALAGTPGWTPERIRAAIEDPATVQVTLTRRIPVLIVYGTAIAGEDGVVRFFDDIYGYDAQLSRTLAAGRRAWR
ncbi:MAG TPA: L,D-transpeptidase family protein, partial [Bryobacteraceae bacterium]|nr:L,D-transpeptidase family protein [Bryobacteraceae bacterium]